MNIFGTRYVCLFIESNLLEAKLTAENAIQIMKGHTSLTECLNFSICNVVSVV